MDMESHGCHGQLATRAEAALCSDDSYESQDCNRCGGPPSFDSPCRWGQPVQKPPEERQNLAGPPHFPVVEDLHGRQGNHVPDHRIRFGSSSFSSTAAWGSALCGSVYQESIDQHSRFSFHSEIDLWRRRKLFHEFPLLGGRQLGPARPSASPIYESNHRSLRLISPSRIVQYSRCNNRRTAAYSPRSKAICAFINAIRSCSAIGAGNDFMNFVKRRIAFVASEELGNLNREIPIVPHSGHARIGRLGCGQIAPELVQQRQAAAGRRVVLQRQR